MRSAAIEAAARSNAPSERRRRARHEVARPADRQNQGNKMSSARPCTSSGTRSVARSAFPRRFTWNRRREKATRRPSQTRWPSTCTGPRAASSRRTSSMRSCETASGTIDVKPPNGGVAPGTEDERISTRWKIEKCVREPTHTRPTVGVLVTLSHAMERSVKRSALPTSTATHGDRRTRRTVCRTAEALLNQFRHHDLGPAKRSATTRPRAIRPSRQPVRRPASQRHRMRRNMFPPQRAQVPATHEQRVIEFSSEVKR